MSDAALTAFGKQMRGLIHSLMYDGEGKPSVSAFSIQLGEARSAKKQSEERGVNMNAGHSRPKLVGYSLAMAILSSLLSVLVYAQIKPPQTSPGLQPFTPTSIDWLTTTLQASLRQEAMSSDGFALQIASPDAETILIYVRYTTHVNRKAMNSSIHSARQVIGVIARRYGWEGGSRFEKTYSAYSHQTNSSKFSSFCVLVATSSRERTAAGLSNRARTGTLCV